ncbi:MAG: hypothetical protein WBL06_07245 [Pseudolysinimonas sp.]|uniref:hypothetical protein n=1 Tax=Pseudolysinimonas sp. TaxID=2680009 RepID=UPI003C74B6AB
MADEQASDEKARRAPFGAREFRLIEDASSAGGFPAVRSPSQSPLIYFDSWVWVQLAQARRSPAHPLREVEKKLRLNAAAGEIQIALTSGNYLELWNRRDSRSRQHVGREMAELSGYVTLRAVHEVLEEELARVTEAWRKLGPRLPAMQIAREWIVGSGARHAFASPTGRYRFVSKIATNSSPEGEEVPMPDEWVAASAAMSREMFEWVNLIGLDNNYDVPGVDYRPEHRLGDEWVASQEEVRAMVDFIGSDDSLMYRLIIGRRLANLFEQFPHALPTNRELASWFRGPADGIGFIGSMPVQQVMVELTYAAHRNARYRFKQHDRTDILELSLTLPYCDVVVPDANWAHHAMATRLAESFGTKVLKDRESLIGWVATL